MSTASRIRERLTSVAEGLAGLIRSLPVHRLNRHEDGILIVAPEYYWSSPSPAQRALQVQLKRDYDVVSELVSVLLGRTPEDLLRHFEDADRDLRRWLELKDNWSLSPDHQQNEALFRGDVATFEHVLSVFDLTGAAEIFVVPDTNAIVAAPDPVGYRARMGQDSFTFMLLPTVLSELDRLKVEHRNPDFREKVQKVIARIKGWRQQGPLLHGVTVDKSITVKALAREPDMAHTLSWLDASVLDDRIIASVLSLQAERPGARVVLITNDVNLQNKADAAFVETNEAP